MEARASRTRFRKEKDGVNFFKMRVINTVLVLFIGLMLGYILRDPQALKRGRYVPVYPRAAEAPKPAAEYGLQSQTTAAADRTPAAPAPRERAEDTAEDYAPPVKPPLETDYEVTYAPGDSPRSAKPSEPAMVQTPEPARPAAGQKTEAGSEMVKGAAEAFFKNPERYLGQYLEMELQMILCRKKQGGWVLNLVNPRDGKNVDYIYIEDDFLLGEQPDLKIGYFYNVSFKCGKGTPSAGNKLLGINPSGRKAAWATGVTAVE